MLGDLSCSREKAVLKNMKAYLFLSIKEMHIFGNQTCTHGFRKNGYSKSIRELSKIY